jgi:4-hydroxybenzoate polyprenyltransferase/geranylgeranylglycerol-phosphate geranylgeranyltransferase
VTATSSHGHSDQISLAGPRLRVRLTDRLTAHVEMWRLDLFSYTGLVSVAGALLASGDRPLWRLAATWLAPSLGWVAAMYGGDYFDRDLDTVTKPQRPVPSGRVKPAEALTGMIVCLILGMVIAVLLNPLNFFVVIAALALGVSYNKYLKAQGIWGNIVRGGVTAMAFIHGTLATSPSLQPKLLPIALIFWLHDSGSNVVGAICDREGDRKGGCRTFPVRYGDTAALWLMLVFDVGWLALAVGYPWLFLGQRMDLAAYAPFLAAAALMGVVSGAMLFRAGRPIPRLTSLRAHEVLVVERLVLTAGFVAAVTNSWIALALLVPSAGAWLVASVVMMRRSYEPSRVKPRNQVAPL